MQQHSSRTSRICKIMETARVPRGKKTIVGSIPYRALRIPARSGVMKESS